MAAAMAAAAAENIEKQHSIEAYRSNNVATNISSSIAHRAAHTFSLLLFPLSPLSLSHRSW